VMDLLHFLVVMLNFLLVDILRRFIAHGHKVRRCAHTWL
jgi:hypothetical protein